MTSTRVGSTIILLTAFVFAAVVEGNTAATTIASLERSIEGIASENIKIRHGDTAPRVFSVKYPRVKDETEDSDDGSSARDEEEHVDELEDGEDDDDAEDDRDPIPQDPAARAGDEGRIRSLSARQLHPIILGESGLTQLDPPVTHYRRPLDAFEQGEADGDDGEPNPIALVSIDQQLDDDDETDGESTDPSNASDDESLFAGDASETDNDNGIGDGVVAGTGRKKRRHENPDRKHRNWRQTKRAKQERLAAIETTATRAPSAVRKQRRHENPDRKHRKWKLTKKAKQKRLAAIGRTATRAPSAVRKQRKHKRGRKQKNHRLVKVRTATVAPAVVLPQDVERATRAPAAVGSNPPSGEPTEAPTRTMAPTRTLEPTYTLAPTRTVEPTGAPTETIARTRPLESLTRASAMTEEEEGEGNASETIDFSHLYFLSGDMTVSEPTGTPTQTTAPTRTLEPTATLAPTRTFEPTGAPTTIDEDEDGIGSNYTINEDEDVDEGPVPIDVDSHATRHPSPSPSEFEILSSGCRVSLLSDPFRTRYSVADAVAAGHMNATHVPIADTYECFDCRNLQLENCDNVVCATESSCADAAFLDTSEWESPSHRMRVHCLGASSCIRATFVNVVDILCTGIGSCFETRITDPRDLECLTEHTCRGLEIQ